ncbi:MAG: hypothetical protein EA361_03010 [Bacteroidetes bacterium]|nr:MAG: hypothetical protein EA361_03010 [Bacteroidota bacterium]
MLQKNRSLLLILLFLASCAVMRPGTQTGEEAHQAFINEDYQSALASYEQIIRSHEGDVTLIPDSVYRNAGLSAFYLEQTGIALNYLNNIRHSEIANAETQYALALLNRQIDNLSREITALESYVENFPEAEHIEEMRERLFETYAESKNYDKALPLWSEIEDSARKEESLLNNYFNILQELEKEGDELYTVANELLALNPDNTDALFFLASHYFYLAENRYQSEMEAYEKNRTHRQYARLLRAFEVLNADFRKSLNYFLHLYKIDPLPRYARFIGNIYLRFDDKEKADYYHRKL